MYHIECMVLTTIYKICTISYLILFMCLFIMAYFRLIKFRIAILKKFYFKNNVKSILVKKLVYAELLIAGTIYLWRLRCGHTVLQFTLNIFDFKNLGNDCLFLSSKPCASLLTRDIKHLVYFLYENTMMCRDGALSHFKTNVSETVLNKYGVFSFSWHSRSSNFNNILL